MQVDKNKREFSGIGLEQFGPITKKSKVEVFEYSLHAFNIQIVAQRQLRVQNVVLICKKDLKKIFNIEIDSNIENNYYVQIADQVYRIAVAKLTPGNIGISDFQNKEMRSAIFESQKGFQQLTLIPFNPEKFVIQPIQRLNLNLSEQEVLCSHKNKIVLPLKNLQETMREWLRSEYINVNNTFCMGFEWGEVRLDVNSLSFSEFDRKQFSSWGKITDETKISFISDLQAKGVVIVDHIYNEEVHHYDFSVSCITGLSPNIDFRFPFSAERLKSSLLNACEGRILCKDYVVTIPHESGFNIKIKLKSAVLHQNATKYNSLKIDELGYELTEKHLCYFTSNSSVLSIVEGPPIDAECIVFEVIGISPNPCFSKVDQSRERWVNAQELHNLLKVRNDHYIKGQTIDLNLESGSYIIRVAEIWAKDRGMREMYESLWKTCQNTKLQYRIKNGLSINLVNDKTIYSLERISFEIKKLNCEGCGVAEVERKDLINHIIKNGPKQFVKNQTFEIFCSNQHMITVEVLDLYFCSKLHEKSVQFITGFGAIDIKTQILFSENDINSIKVIDANKEDRVEEKGFPESTELSQPTFKFEDVLNDLEQKLADIFKGPLFEFSALSVSLCDKFQEENKSRGLKRSKGALLYGPPGTGKTSFANEIAKRIPKERLININARTILEKSTEEICEVFHQINIISMQTDIQNSQFFIIIDKLEAVVGEKTAVNVFLDELGKVYCLENVFFIYVSDSIDEKKSLILEKYPLNGNVEFKLPSPQERKKLFEKISKPPSKKQLFNKNLNFNCLAEKTHNFSFGDIKALVELANNYSLLRLHKQRKKEKKEEDDSQLINMDDFENAINAQKKIERKGLSNEAESMFI